jgi:hypothetical protein
MTKQIVSEINCENNEITVLEQDETAAEIKEKLEREKEIASHKAEQQSKFNARQAILDRLGLTADEAAILLG